jgi:hypothetical protein
MRQWRREPSGRVQSVKEVSMVYRGHVKQGVVVLDEPVTLPEGAAVEVAVLEAPARSATPGDSGNVSPAATPSILERLKPLAGAVAGLPRDLAENHDHYLYGRAKK